MMTRISVLRKHFKHMLYVCYCHLIVHHPAHVFEVAIIEKCRTVKLHPHTQLLHTERAHFWKYVTERVRKILTLNSKAQTRGNAEVGNKDNYRYLFRNIPLKRISIMLSISALFSCSFMGNSTGQMRQHLCTVVLYKSGAFLTSVIFRCIFSSCSGLFCLVVFVLCTSYSFWLFSMLTCRLRLTPTRALTNFSAGQGCQRYPLVSWMQLHFSTCSMIYLLMCRCVWRPV